MVRIAINGFGRIGRAAFKIMLDTPGLDIAAINDLAPADNLAYLLKYDSVYGRLQKDVRSEGSTLIVDGKRFDILNEKDPSGLPWKDRGVDIVLECSGHFTNREGMEKHLQAGARYVLLSAPSKTEEVATIIPGVNSATGNSSRLISCASCTTNSVAPVVEILSRRIGVKKAILTTLHAYTASQSIVDSPNRKFRRGRAGAINFVPSSTGAAIATTRTLPHLKNKFDGIAVRGPVPVGSVSDITAITERTTSVEELNAFFREEAASDRYRDIIGASDEEIVSSDIVMDPRAAIIDLTMTRVVDGDLVKVMSWYDNEWGYCHQLVRQAALLGRELGAEKETAGAR